MKTWWIARRLQSGDRIERPGPFTPTQKRRTLLFLAALVAAAVFRSIVG